MLCGYHLARETGAQLRWRPFLLHVLGHGLRDQFQIAANGITRFGLGGAAVRTGLFASPASPTSNAP